MAGIDKFSRQQFEEALAGILPEKWTWTSRGLVQGQYTYLVDMGSPHVKLIIFSSIDGTGFARDCAKDSIRANMCTVDAQGLITLLPGKVQTYVKRTSGWRVSLSNMLRQIARLAAWIQPCPKCKEMLRLAVRRANKEVYLFCPTDAANKDNPNHVRHTPFMVLDFETGQLLRESHPEPPRPQPETTEDAPKCPKCSSPMVRMSRGNGWRCGVPGNRWKDGKWSICDGVVWDD